MTRARLIRGFAIITAVLLFLLAGAVYWLFYNNGPSPSAPYHLDMAAVRAEAGRLRGLGPDHIEFEIVSHDAVPRIAMVGGTGWRKVDLVRVSYRVVYPNQSIIIDTGYDEAAARRYGADRFDRAARTRVLRGLDEADRIVVTHEHDDHLGGALTSPHLPRLLPKLLLTRAQIGSSQTAPWPAQVKDRPKPFDYPVMRAIAPGMVLINAPGDTPGSQLIYVRQANGREYLFMGDVASMQDNVRLHHQRSRYVTGYISGDD